MLEKITKLSAAPNVFMDNKFSLNGRIMLQSTKLQETLFQCIEIFIGFIGTKADPA